MTKLIRQSLFVMIVLACGVRTATAQTGATLAWDEDSSNVNGFAVTVDGTGKTLYVTNVGSNNVSAYSIDSSTGATTGLDKSPFAAGTRPVFATLDPAGKFLYVCNQSSKNITKFQINPDTGGLPSNTISTTLDVAPASLVFAK